MYTRVFKTLKEQGMVQTATVLEGDYAGEKIIYWENDAEYASNAHIEFWQQKLEALRQVHATGIVEIDGVKCFVELFMEQPRLVLCGGGHVSLPVCKIAKMLDFHVTVVDDRPEFASKERFTEADEVICAPFERLSEVIAPYKNTYYVVLTRGHQGDHICAHQILSRSYAYLGMIGSKTKVALTRERLQREGFAQERIDSMHAPIGLKIGGQMPEEIAVSIMAEIVQVKNQKKAAYVDEDVANAVLSGIKGTMTTIVEKRGSGPRGVGSKMLVGENGKTYGSIGGGSVEYQVTNIAAQTNHGHMDWYDLSAADSTNLGMICGGNARVLFEQV